MHEQDHSSKQPIDVKTGSAQRKDGKNSKQHGTESHCESKTRPQQQQMRCSSVQCVERGSSCQKQAPTRFSSRSRET